MNDETVAELRKITAPYGRDIGLYTVEHESGLSLLRIRIREGNRFTILDIDRDTATQLAAAMSAWANSADQ